MRASFVIVNYNRKDEILLTISKTRQTIAETAGDFEIIVVDNASTDGSAEAIADQFPEVVLVKNPENTGAPAWNIGFKKAQGNSFIILDDDSHIEHGLEEALNYIEGRKDVGVLALQISGGIFQTSHWTDRNEMAGFIGCGAIIKRELYQIIGGYADWIFLYTNEYEYGIRCIEAGYKIIYFQECSVFHRTSVINRSNRRLITFSVRNEMAIVYKYFSARTRNFYVWRVFANNLKGIRRYGLASIVWYYDALKEMKKLKPILQHTPVKMQTEKFYRKNFWSTRPWLEGLMLKAKGSNNRNI